MPDTAPLRPYRTRDWRIAALLFVSYTVIGSVFTHVVPESTYLFPLGAIAIGVLFLSGLYLWPVVYASALLTVSLSGPTLPEIILMPIAYTLEAFIAAYILRRAGIDPLFRRFRDMSYTIIAVLLVSLIAPTLGTIADILAGDPYASATWGYWYAASVFGLLIGTPFILRWFAKLRFGRPPIELLETGAAFALIIGINVSYFMLAVQTVVGIPLFYLLLIPLFWVALRLRPRFVTLALLITSLFAVASTLTGVPTDFLNAALFEIETFLITVAIMFLIIVSLEEDRRLNTNLMRSQLVTLENAVARVSSESKAKNDFIAILAHELRNPLAPVMSSIEYLKLKGGQDEENVETLDMMEDRMHTVRRLLDDLLDISRISEGKVALKRESVDLTEIIRRAVLTTAHNLKERHQPLSLKISEAAPLLVAGDPVRLEQIFTNLLTNASKYSDPGDTITLIVRRTPTMAEVVVIDEGVGIEGSALSAIFTPFHQVEQGARSRKGLGIGLALVRSFVEMHDGVVTVASDGPGKGSRFTVRIPLLAAEDAVEAPEVEPTLRSAKGARPKVLVVDDNDAAAGGIGRLLELQGCKVLYAYDGGQALDTATATRPAVILLDVGLPDQDGYTVAKKLRAQGYQGTLIALTGYSTDEARDLSLAAGFDHYLVKPAGLAELRRVIPGLS